MNQIIKKFNNLVKRTIFKVQNKTNNNFNISGFNKYLITFIVSLFLYLFYLLTPLLYDKAWIQTNIEKKLLNEFKVNLSTSADISYRILPAPHFLIKDSKILVDDAKKSKSIAEIKDFKVFLSQKNLFNKKNLNIKKIDINEANFSLLISDFKLLNEITSKDFSNKKIKIHNSNIFFKDNLGEVISIIKVDKAILFFDDKELLNLFNLKGEIFNIPFIFDFNNRNDSKKYKEINFNSKLFKFNISNKSTKEKKLTTGENNILFLKSIFNTRYDIKEKLVTFKSSNSRLRHSKIDYTGELSINPFDLNFNIYLDSYKISELFNVNPILIEFLKSGILFNDNISINTSTIINSKIKNEIFQNAKINFRISNGNINFNETKFINDDIGSLQLINSNLFYKNNELLFNSDILVDIKNSENLFSFLNTNKSLRKNFKTIMINLDYNFFNDDITFNSLKIDNKKVSNELLAIVGVFNKDNLNNLQKYRRLINKLLDVYEG